MVRLDDCCGVWGSAGGGGSADGVLRALGVDRHPASVALFGLVDTPQGARVPTRVGRPGELSGRIICAGNSLFWQLFGCEYCNGFYIGSRIVHPVRDVRRDSGGRFSGENS